MATLEKEDFWGCELKKGSAEVKFNPEFEDSELSQVEHKLILSQACLGPKSSGRCLVEVTAHDYRGDEIKNIIVCLQHGGTEMCPLNLSFNPPATFKLVEGSGPVHLTGNHVQSLAEDELDSSEESDEEAPQLIDSKISTKSKRPLSSSSPSGPPKKLAKTTKVFLTEDDDEDDEEEEGEDEDEEEESSDEEEEEEAKESAKPAPTKKEDKKGQKKEENNEDEDDEEEDEEEDEDSDEDDESEEESGEEESESEEEESDEVTKNLTGKKESAKKLMTNGISSKKDDKKTPSKSQQKTPQDKTDKPKDLDSIKKALLKSPSLPKKIEKFKNFMRSSYKITDEETVKGVWEYIQNNKK